MRLPAWELLSAWDQHECLKLLADRRGLSIATAAVDDVIQTALACYGTGDESGTTLYLGGPLSPGIYYRSPWSGWRLRPSRHRQPRAALG